MDRAKPRPDPADGDAIDQNAEAEKQIRKFEPDELDGPAEDLDRTLDDENPGERR